MTDEPTIWTPQGEKAIGAFDFYDRSRILDEKEQEKAVSEMGPAERREVWGTDRQKALGWEPGDMALILGEFTEEQYRWGNVVMNREIPGETTRRYIVRAWGRGTIPCPRCHQKAFRTFAVADTYGWLIECSTCRDIVEESNVASRKYLQGLEQERRRILTP